MSTAVEASVRQTSVAAAQMASSPRRDAVTESNGVVDAAATPVAARAREDAAEPRPTFDASRMSDKLAYFLLTAVADAGGADVRNHFASLCKTFTRVNRHYCVTTLAVHGRRTAVELYRLFVQYSNLRAAIIDDATNLPRSFVGLFRRTNPSLDNDEAATHSQKASDRSILATLHEIDGVTRLNPLESLKINKNGTITSDDLTHLNYFVALRQLILNELTRVQTLGFLFHLPALDKLILLDLERCYNVNADRIRLPDPSSLAEMSAVERQAPPPEKKVEEIGDDDDDENEEESSTKKSVVVPAPRELEFDYAQAFGRMSSLRVLNVRLCSKLNNRLMPLLVDGSPLLESLNVHSCEWVSDIDLVHVRNMSALHWFNASNIDTLSFDALKCLTYVPSACIETLVANERVLYDDDDEEEGEAVEPLVDFMRDNRELVRGYYEREVRPGRVSTNDTLDSITRVDFSRLSYVDFSWCKFQAFDVLVLTKLLAARRVLLDGCEIFVNYHDIDQAFAKFAASPAHSAKSFREARPHAGVTVNSELVGKRFRNPVEFAGSFGDEWQRVLSVQELSMRKCTFSAIDVHQFSAPTTVRASKSERDEVIGRHKLLFAKHLRNVEKMSFSSVQAIDKYSLPYVAYWMRALTSIDLSACTRLDDDALINFTEMMETVGSQLLQVRLDDCTRLTTSGIAYFLRGQPQLTHFAVDRCIDATNAAFRDLPPALERLDVAGCVKLTKNFLSDIAVRCPRLRSLDVSGTLINDEALVKHVGKCAQLELLLVNDCERVSDLGVVFVCGQCTSLRSLSMERTPQVSREAVVACLFAIPDRRIQVKA